MDWVEATTCCLRGEPPTHRKVVGIDLKGRYPTTSMKLVANTRRLKATFQKNLNGSWGRYLQGCEGTEFLHRPDQPLPLDSLLNPQMTLPIRHLER
jgi:hypothetical protein